MLGLKLIHLSKRGSRILITSLIKASSVDDEIFRTILINTKAAETRIIENSYAMTSDVLAFGIAKNQ